MGLFGKMLTLNQTTYFRLVQNESLYRRQNKCDWTIKICLGREENIVGKGENAGYQKALFSGTLKVGIVW